MKEINTPVDIGQNEATYYRILEGELASLGLVASDGALKKIVFMDREVLEGIECLTSHPILDRAEGELRAYMQGKLRSFSVPLAPEGTEFQKKVWQAMLEIPYGETKTYGEVAALIGSPKGARAVGMAANKNPIPIIVPCHRIIGASGKLVGYAGGLSLKEKLLQLELKYEI